MDDSSHVNLQQLGAGRQISLIPAIIESLASKKVKATRYARGNLRLICGYREGMPLCAGVGRSRAQTAKAFGATSVCPRYGRNPFSATTETGAVFLSAGLRQIARSDRLRTEGNDGGWVSVAATTGQI
jgi:hypothetical protein